MTDQPYETATPTPDLSVDQETEQDETGQIFADDAAPVPVHDEPAEYVVTDGWTPLADMTLEEKVDELLELHRTLADTVVSVKAQAEENPMGLIQSIMSGGLGGVI